MALRWCPGCGLPHKKGNPVAISQHLTTFADRPVQDWSPDDGPIVPAVCYRVSLSYDDADGGEEWTDRFAALLDHPGVDVLEGLVVGAWGEMFDDQEEATRVVEALVAARDRLPQLRALFFGDITYEECEVSWIQNTDVAPLFDAYPFLEYFAVRGANGLRLGALRHDCLRSLAVQCGGLAAEITHEVLAAQLPRLEYLELWLGTAEYGRTTTVEDLAPLLRGELFPVLTYLGLRDSEIADEVAMAVASAPIVERIQTLDLSLGTLGDEGASALLASSAVRRLTKLDLHHHYCSVDVVTQFQALGVSVDLSDPQDEEQHGGERWRYVAVGE